MGYDQKVYLSLRSDIDSLASKIFIFLIAGSFILPIIFSWASIVDELLILSLLVYSSFKLILKGTIGRPFFSLVLVFLYFVLISIFFGYNKSIVQVIVQSIIHIKFFILFYVLVNLYKKGCSLLYKLTNAFFYFTLFGLLGSFLFRENFYSFFGILPEYRNDELRHGGFVKSNFLAVFYYLYFLFHFAKLYYQGRKYKPVILLVTYTILLFITGSRAAIILMPVTFVLFYFKYLVSKIGVDGLKLIAIGGVLFILSLYFYTDFIEKTFTNINDIFDLNSHYIRGIMIHLSVLIALDYFPIGTGSGTFGTVFSQDSDVYEIYGVAHRSYFRDMEGIYDSNISSILGEFGFIGLFILIVLSYNLFRFLRRKGVPNKVLLSLKIFLIFYLCTRSILMNTTLALISVIIFILIINENFTNFKCVPEQGEEV